MAVTGVGTQTHVTRDGEVGELGPDVPHGLHHGVGLRPPDLAHIVLGHSLGDAEQEDGAQAVIHDGGEEIHNRLGAPARHTWKTADVLSGNRDHRN